jgi:hypothetical protein
MAVTQYIGARYVPQIDGEWARSKTYEPLTVVLYQGNSYTSRQAVPRGIDIQDSRFWALTGNYNTQIEQYRREVAQFDGRIDGLETEIDPDTTNVFGDAAYHDTSDNASSGSDAVLTSGGAYNIMKNNSANFFGDSAYKDYDESPTADSDNLITSGAVYDTIQDTLVVIGDSYTAQYPAWIERLAKNIGCTTVINKGVGGAGFLAPGDTPGNTFIQQVDKAFADSTPDKVKSVVVLGGFNDVAFGSRTANDIAAAVIACYNRILEKFPKSKVYFFPFQMVKSYMTKDRSVAIREVKRGMSYTGIPYDSNFTIECLMNTTIGNDGIHPTSAGYMSLCSYVSSVLSGSGISRRSYTEAITPSSYVDAVENFISYAIGGHYHMSGQFYIKEEIGTEVQTIATFDFCNETDVVITARAVDMFHPVTRGWLVYVLPGENTLKCQLKEGEAFSGSATVDICYDYDFECLGQ